MNYWIVKDGKKLGPMSLDELFESDITPDTLVWYAGLPTWTKAQHIAELAERLTREAPHEAPTSEDCQHPEVEATTQPLYHVEQRPYISRTHTPAAAQPTDVPPQPPTYFGWCIAALILCCMVPAIVALIYSTKVSSRYISGDFDGAQRASETAGLWLITSLVLGLVSLPFYILINLLG